MKNSSDSSKKIIQAESLGEVKRWKLPSVDDGRPRKPKSTPAPAPAMPTAAELEEIQKQAFEEGRKAGFEYGHNEALETFRAQIKQQLEQFEGLMRGLEQPFNELDDAVEQSLVKLVIAMVRQLVRREIKLDPNHIIGVVREAMSILPVASRNVRLVLHPEDAELVRQIYTLDESEPGWQIVEDPVLARGGCRVLTDTSQVDATLESRLAALIAPLLAAERQQDSDESGVAQ